MKKGIHPTFTASEVACPERSEGKQSPVRKQRALLPGIFFLALLLAALACSLPAGALPTPTSSLAQPAASSAATLLPTLTSEVEAVAATPRSSATPRPPVHRIELRRVYGVASFYDRSNDQAFTPRGVNYFYLVLRNASIYENRVFGVGEFDLGRVRQDFQQISQAGYNTVRIFLDLCQPGPECIVQEGEAGLNPAYLDSIVQVMQAAKEAGLLLILASNDLPDGLRYAQLADNDADQNFSSYRNATFLTPSGIQAVRNYWNDLLGGLAAGQAPFDTVLGWELLNEQWYMSEVPPFSLDAGSVTTANGKTYNLADPASKQRMAVDGMRYYVQQVRQAILEHDPGGLVTMGFFAPVTPHEWRSGDTRYVETAGLLQESELDFFDFHLYPGSSLSQAELVENFGLPGYNQKPVLMGEVGAYTALYPTIESAARGLQDWIAESCGYGFDGWLTWGYYRAPEELSDAAWGFADGDGLLQQALSPNFQPDACTPTVLRGDNLALGKPVKASSSLTDQPAEQAVDGSPASWSSGADAPGWIEIDLGGLYAIGSLRMTVEQWPDGETLHEIWVVGENGKLRKVAELAGWTSDGQVLEWTPSEPLENVRLIRVVTTLSPSWVGWEEIEVIAP
jgi:hypothetical protein